MNIGIFGIGAIGSTIAFTLSKNENLNLFYFNGSKRTHLKLVKESEKIEIPITLSQVIHDQYDLDWLIICLKAYHFEAALPSIKKLLQSNTKVMVIRNGLDLKAPLLPIITEDRILEAIIDCPVQPEASDYFRFYHAPILSIPNIELAHDCQSLFKKEFCQINIVEDFRTFCWKKVCESSSLGGILCLSGATAWIFKNEELLKLYEKVLTEGVNVARANGANIELDFIDKMKRKLLQYPDGKSSSMLTDRNNGNRIELGAKNGLIVDWGKKLGIATPLNELICQLLKCTNQSHK